MFAERDDHGRPKQQDAEECYTQFLSSFSQAFKYGKRHQSDGDVEMIDDTNANQDPV